jgi:hypothetical protein
MCPLAAADRVPVGNAPARSPFRRAWGRRSSSCPAARRRRGRPPFVDDHAVDPPSAGFARGPGLSSVERNVCAAVVGLDHVERVVGIEPQVVVISVRNLDALVEGLSPVHRLEEVDVQAVHGVLVRGVGVDMNVVPGALPQVRVPVDAPEGIASVVRAVYPALVSLGLEETKTRFGFVGRRRRSTGRRRPREDRP